MARRVLGLTTQGYYEWLKDPVSQRGFIEVGGGIRTALVLTPAATLLGVIENPHFPLPG